MAPQPQDAALAADAAAFRQFNRVYTRFLGTLSEGFLSTEFSLAEGRVIYELATRPKAQAKEIGETLGLDAGYLSRILTKFEKAGLLTRRTSKLDSRAADLQLTARGRTTFRTLNTRAEKQARDFLKALPSPARADFTGAVRTMERFVAGKDAPPPTWTLRTHRPGDMGTIVALEGAGYVHQFGWDGSFEALVARIVADFIANFNPERERCWIAEIPGPCSARHVGHIFLVQHPEQPGAAKLRLLYVDPAARGLGLGKALVDECVRFAREAGYSKVVLWTQSILTSAHRLYQNAGFRLVEEQPHHSFGKDLIGQTWELIFP
jgi:DNA-binding MarR family transcriptional regulator/GNAT superfamily N-acetyltransferase